MSHSFIAYIDESGDDGLSGRYRQAGARGGSSHWLSIGAVIWRLSRDLDMANCARDIIADLPNQKQGKPLHFKDLSHPQRVMATRHLVRQRFQTSVVMAYKPIIPEGIYVQKNQLYHYMTRYLLERVSWLCRDYRRHVPEGDGRVKIVFSRRGGMDYQDFQNYLNLLRNADDPEIRIHWPVIDIAGVQAEDHGQRYGLQLADVAVSGLAAAVEYDLYGNLEPRFARSLRPRIYRRNGNYLSYGAKLVPAADQIAAHKREGVQPADLSEWLDVFGG